MFRLMLKHRGAANRRAPVLALTLFTQEVPQGEPGLVKVGGQAVRLGFELHLQKQLPHLSHFLLN